jgi:signal transduction histidine kinase
VLTVADDGPGKASGNGGTGIGLANVRNRLAARFGDFAHVDSGPCRRGLCHGAHHPPRGRRNC